MRCGTLRHRVAIEYELEAPDTFGSPDRTWVNLDTVSAEIEPLHGRELLEAQQVFAGVNYQIRIRYLAGVNETCRVTFGSGASKRYFDINAALNPAERNRELILLCTEKAV
ncbi:MAG TPA: phage head closure protein [Sedimentisphaerales bacterium]|nr:phage head closure protein [Sedimentisphaerales bacterium]